MKKSNRTEFDEDEMPCPCIVCGGWFDLNDGLNSKVHRNTVICEDCGNEEKKSKREIEDNDEYPCY